MSKTLILKNAEEVCLHAAHRLAGKINTFKPTLTKPYLVFGLPTGGTPKEMYKELIRLHKEAGLSFKNVATFNMDEYCDLPIKHPESYHAFMHENLFNHIDILPENIHILNGLAKDKQLECARYEFLIMQSGGIDIQVGGIGTNGHIAFNEPSTPFNLHTHEVTLTPETRKDNARFFDGDIHQVPKSALTIGLATIMSAKEVIILATGENKADAITKSIDEPQTPVVPASILQNHPNAHFYCDEGAAKNLKKLSR